MTVKTLIRFTDLKENAVREVGDEFEVTKERLGEILLVSSIPLVEVIQEEKKRKSTKKVGD